MAGAIAVSPKFYFPSSTGAPLANGTLTTYLAGTTTLEATYQDKDLSTANWTTITLDARGECVLWLDDTKSYKFVLKNSAGVTQYTVDNVSGVLNVATLGFGSTTLAGFVNAQTCASYAALRSYTGTATAARVTGYLASATPAGIAGSFVYDPTDTTTADDGGTVIVGSDARRWKRQYDGNIRETWFGAVGDGSTDDAAALLNSMNAAVSAGRTLSLNGAKTYAISSLAVPAGLHFETNGATFQAHATNASNTPLMTVAADVRVFGKLTIVIPTAMRRDRALTVSGADCVFGDIDVSSVDQQANTTDADDAAVRFVSATNVRFGRLRVDKFDQSVQFKTTSNVGGGRFDLTSYTRAVYLDDVTVLRMAEGGWIRTASANATYTPGHVGVLVSATTDDASQDIVIPGLLVEDAAEHGVRVAGPARVSDVHFPSLTTKNTGGCGLKILGTDSGTPTSRNKNITFHGATFEDCGSGTLTTNMCAVLAMYCDGVYGDNIVVRKNSKTYSAHSCVRVAACADVRITGDFADAQYEGAWLDGSLGDIDRCHIAGISRSNGSDGYVMAAGANVIRRPTTDLICDGNGALGFNIAVGAGSMTDGLFKFKLHSNTSGAGTCDSTAATFDMFGVEGSTLKATISAANGSRWSEGSNLYVMKAGTWTAAS